MKDMSCCQSQCSQIKESLGRLIETAGGVAWGVAAAEEVDSAVFAEFERWIACEKHGEMQYMSRYMDIRCNPQLLLAGAQSLVVVAFSYYHGDQFEGNLCRIAAYAHGDDYHEIVRSRLENVAEYIRHKIGGETRVCVDTAPLLERYWGEKAGVGIIGSNRMLIVPGIGSYVFLGIILTTEKITADIPLSGGCGDCRRCFAACPVGALSEEGIDARRCLSYQTIEYRGEFAEEVELCGRLYGCDECQRECPHNKGIPETNIAEFQARESLRGMTATRVLEMTQEEFSRDMRKSAIKRAKLSGLQRNAARLQQESAKEKSEKKG